MTIIWIYEVTWDFIILCVVNSLKRKKRAVETLCKNINLPHNCHCGYNR
jgi:hypothetical protein